jgi:hypothetical protein
MVRRNKQAMLIVIIIGLGLTVQADAVSHFFNIFKRIRSSISQRNRALLGGSVSAGLFGYWSQEQGRLVRPQSAFILKGRVIGFPNAPFEAKSGKIINEARHICETTSVEILDDDRLIVARVSVNSKYENIFPSGCTMPSILPLRYFQGEAGAELTFDICKNQSKATGIRYKLMLKPEIQSLTTMDLQNKATESQ